MTRLKRFFLSYGHLLVLGAGFFLGIRRLQHFLVSDIPLGYDPGVYKAIFMQYEHFLQNFDPANIASRVRREPLIGILAALLHKLYISYDWMITRGIGIISILPGFILFFIFKTQSTKIQDGARVGSIAAFLYRISITQYQLFRRGYMKQTLAISIMLLIIFFITKKKIRTSAILFFFLILLHKHTGLYAGAVLLGDIILEWTQTKHLPKKKIIFWGMAGVLALLCYIPLWNRIIPDSVQLTKSTFLGDGYGGTFISRMDFLRLQGLGIILSICGVARATILKKKITIRTIGYIIGMIWVSFGLINYNRTLVFFDIFVIYRVAYFLVEIVRTEKRIGIPLIIISIGINCTLYLFHIAFYNQNILISEDEFTAINKIADTTEPNAIIMNTHKNYSPRIMGRGQRDYINPGMADIDIRPQKTRNNWRLGDGAAKCSMIKQVFEVYNRPIYIRIGERQPIENFSGATCVKAVSQGKTWGMYKFIY